MKDNYSMTKMANKYLEMRRGLGFLMKIEGQELLRFAKYADQNAPGQYLTVELGLQWVQSTRSNSPMYRARRLDLVRRFASFLLLFDPKTEVPSRDLIGCTHRRPMPYIYTDEEVVLLLKAASKLGPAGGLRPRTYTTLFGLLASTGMRIREVLSLNREDVDLEKGVIRINQGKFSKSRLIPLHASVTKALFNYGVFRDSYNTSLNTAFFVTEKNTRQKYHKTLMTFIGLRQQLKLEIKRGGQKYPRLHDFRHTFAVNRICAWYKQEVDVNLKLPTLATYLGHVKVADTYWYLSNVPKLMAMASSRFEKYVGGLEVMK